MKTHTEVYRFTNAGDPEELVPKLQQLAPRDNVRASLWTRVKESIKLLVSSEYRTARAEAHMQGETDRSPFVSVVTKPANLANSTDPWALKIVTGKVPAGTPDLPHVQRAPDLGKFLVPNSKIVSPKPSNTLSTAETERVVQGDLGPHVTGWQTNPF
jgi:hypothetical protein